jgi:hypothetical protein
MPSFNTLLRSTLHEDSKKSSFAIFGFFTDFYEFPNTSYYIPFSEKDEPTPNTNKPKRVLGHCSQAQQPAYSQRTGAAR